MANESASDVVAILTSGADAAALPRPLVVGCAYAESRLNPLARHPSDPSKYFVYWSPPDPFDVSGGLGQKIVRYMQPYLDWCSANGHNPDAYPGDGVIADMLDLLNDPREATRIMCADLASKWRIYGPNMEKALAAYNWPSGGGSFYSEAHAQNYRSGLEAAARILGAAVPTIPPYNPDARIDQQPDSWSCSIQATEFLLRSVGRDPGDQWIQDAMIGAGLVTTAQGLMDGSGAELAAWLTREYGTERGWSAASADSVTFDDIAAGAGVNPTLIGGHQWGVGGHWAGVRRMNADGSLELANSADGYTGIGQRMTRDEWDARGPWSAVYIDRAAMGVTPIPIEQPAFDRAAVAARLRDILAYHDTTAAKIHDDLTALIAMTEGVV